MRTAGIVAGLGALLLAAPAGAALGNEPSRPWVTDGPVYAVAATPNEVYLGGAFTLDRARDRLLGRGRPGREGRPARACASAPRERRRLGREARLVPRRGGDDDAW